MRISPKKQPDSKAMTDEEVLTKLEERLEELTKLGVQKGKQKRVMKSVIVEVFVW